MKLIRMVALALLLATLLGCGGEQILSPTPGSMDDVLANLVLRGATVHRLVSGDAGCPSSTLHDNAVYMEVALGQQSALHPIYLIRWRRASDYTAGAADFADCVAEYQALHPEAQVGQLESEPWRAYGPFWNEMLESTLRDALRTAGGG